MLRTAYSEPEAIKLFLRPLQEVAGRLAPAIGSETPGVLLDESVRADQAVSA